MQNIQNKLLSLTSHYPLFLKSCQCRNDNQDFNIPETESSQNTVFFQPSPYHLFFIRSTLKEGSTSYHCCPKLSLPLRIVMQSQLNHHRACTSVSQLIQYCIMINLILSPLLEYEVLLSWELLIFIFIHLVLEKIMRSV